MTATSNAPAAHPASGLTRSMMWMLGALVSFSLIAVAGREASRVIPTSELMFWRTLIGVAVLTAILFATGGSWRDLRSSRMPLHTIRSGVHFIAQFSWLYALTLIPLVELFSIEFTAPLMVAVLAPLVLGERLTGLRIVAALLGFVGILVIVQPGSVAVTKGTMVALTSAIGFAFSMITVKSLTRTDNTFQIIFWMNALQMVLAFALVLHSGTTAMDARTWGYVLAVAICGLTAHYSLTQAFKHADAILVAPLDFIRLPLIAFVGFMLYGEPLRPVVLAGGAIIIAANLLNLLGEHRGRRRSAQ